MNDYRSWSFIDRSFFFAFMVSLLWHLFWFFSVTIVVTPPKKSFKTQPVVVSLGPVLNDAIFKTLVENRPEISKAFYRPPADFSTATEIPIQTIERYLPGDVVSVPLGKRFMSTLKEVLEGGKILQEADDYFEFSGTVDPFQILSRPPAPSIQFFTGKFVEIEFLIDARGRAIDLEVVTSSGDASVDLAWEKHLRQWIFSEENILDVSKARRLRVKFRSPSRGTNGP